MLRAVTAALTILCGFSFAEAATLSGNVEGSLDLSGSPYQVISNLTVSAGKTLTIQPGVVLLFSQNVGITVNGALISAGTPADPVIITSAQDGSAGGSGTGSAGQWGVFQFSDAGSAPQLTNTIIRFGQKVVLTNSSPQFNNVSISTMSVAAMTADLASFPTGFGNIAFGSPVNGIVLPAGTVSQNGTLGIVGIPYIIRSGNIIVGATSKLTISPGTVFKSLNSRLQVEGTLIAAGTPEAPITFTSLRDDTISGDSNQAEGAVSPARGDWLDVFIYGEASSGSRLENVIMKWGGASESVGGSSSNLNIYNSTATVLNCDIGNSAYDGINVGGPSSTPLIDGCNIHDNPRFGIRSGNTGGGPLILRNSTLAHNAGWGAYLNLAAEISSNTFVSNGNGLYLAGGGVTAVSSNTVDSNGTGFNLTGTAAVSFNTFVNNTGDMLYLYANGYLTGSGNVVGPGNAYAGISLNPGTWNTSGVFGKVDYIPYLLKSGTVVIGAGTKWTISPGTVFKSLNSRLQVEGTLSAVGTTGSPITFTSLRDDTIGGDSNQAEGAVSPARGDWWDVLIYGESSSGSRLENAIMRWGGAPESVGGSSANLNIYNSTAAVLNCDIGNSAYDGINVGGPAATPLIEGCNIHNNPRFGIRSGNTGGGPLTLRNSTLAHNASWGAYLNQATAISSNTIVSNGAGLYLAGGGSTVISSNTVDSNGTGFNITGTAAVSFNSFVNNSGDIIYLYANGYITGSGNVIGPGNTYAGISLNPGTWNTSGVFGKVDDIPYLLKSGTVVIGSGVKWTIPPGTVFKSLNSRLEVDGTLMAAGTPEAPITFTSLRDDTIGGDSNQAEGAVSPARGDWSDVFLNDSGSSGSRLENVIMRWGGASENGGGSSANLDLYNSTAAILNCDIGNSAYDGIRVDGMAATPLIESCNIHNNQRFGVRSGNTGGGPLTLRNSTLAHNASWGAYLNQATAISSNTIVSNGAGLYLAGGGSTVISSNTVDSNGTGFNITGTAAVSFNTFVNNSGDIIYLYANGYLSGSGNVVGPGNTYAGISLNPGIWNTRGVFGKVDDIPYLLKSGTVVIGAGAKWTIPPGTVFKSLNSRLEVDGTLSAVGTPEAPITFTSLRDDTVDGDSNQAEGAVSPARGDWSDVFIYGEGSSGSRLENVIMRWGGASESVGGSYANLYINNSTPTVKYSQIRLSYRYGVRVEGPSAKPLILGNLITQNLFGIYASNAIPEVHGCNIQGNTSYGLYNPGAGAVVNAQSNYWGHSTGPRDTSDNPSDPTHLYNPDGQGDVVTDYVNYSNFLSTPAAIIQPVVLSSQRLNASPARPDSTVGVRIYFNEDMDTSVSPVITYGPTAPFDLYVISSGAWTAANSYEAYAVLPALPDGTYTMKITGAQDFMQSVVTPSEQPFYTVDSTPPQSPSSFNATSLSGGRIALSWTAPSGEPAASYSIYRATFDFVSLSGLAPVQTGISAVSVIDLPPTDGFYFYSVTALDAAGNESAPSTRPSAYSVRVAPSAPENFIAVFDPDRKQVSLTWAPPLTGGAASYNIYRATYAASGTTEMTFISSATLTAAADAPLADATYYYRVTALDIVGNESPVAAAPGVVFDIHAPVITLSGFADGTYYNGDISILVTIADFSPVDSTITLNGAAIGNASLITEPGRYTLAAQARDSFGLSTSVVRGFVIDKSAPYLAIISPANGLITNQDVSVIYTSTDDFSAAGQLLIRDDQNRAPPFAYTAEGVKTTTITVTDQAGNISTAAVTFTIDKTAPAPVTDFRLNSFLIASGNVDLIFTAPADNISGVADYVIKAATFPISAGNFDAAPVLIQGIPAQAPGTPEPYIIPVSTSFTLYFALKSRDFAGNISGISNAVIMDVQPPTLTAIDPAPSWFINRPSTFSVQAADDISVSSVVFSVDGVVVSTLSAPPYLFKWDILSFADGNHTLTARAEDAAGNRTTVSSVYYVLYQPPSVPVISSPYSGFSVAIPTFTITGTGEPGTTVQVRINGSVLVSTPVASDGSYTAIVTLPTEGSYTLAVFAADSRGAGSASAPISIEYNVTAPNAPSSVSAASMPGGKVRLTWLAPSGKAPAHYRVYRSDSETALVSGAPAVTGLLIAGPVTALTLDNTPSADGFYYYAVTARDAAGNESVLSDVAYALSDSVVPSASVALPGITPPLGAGAYPVQVIVSEVLTAAPYFTFTPSGGAPIQISLEPSVIANIWVATLTITQAMPSGTGSFSFQGTDLSGNSGQTITSGSALALETSGPVANISFVPAAGPSLKAGHYPLKLTLNEPAAATPEFDSIGASTETIYLSSSTDAAVWDGVINISTATGEGVHNFAWSALDSLGNAGTLISGATYFIADTVPPGAPMSLNWSFGAGGAVLLNWSGVGEKPASYCVYRDSTLLNCSVLPGGAGLTGAFTDIPPQEGGHAYHVTALDKAGNESLPSNGVTAQSDATPPSAPASISASPAEAGGVDVTWSAGPGEAPSGFRLYRSTTVITSVSGLAYRALVGSRSTDQPQTDGVYYYAISAVDLAGNESAVAVSAPVSYDKAAPVITLTGIVDGGYYMTPVNPVFSAYDLNLNTSSLTALLDNAAFTSGSPVRTAGGHTLTVNASDMAGHTASKTVSFIIDLSSPVITLSGIANGGYYTAAVTPVISASDVNLSSVTALLNGQTFVSGSAITDNGAYTLEITATDRAGNTTHISAAFNVDLPPQKAQNLAALIEDGSALTLTWSSAGSGVSVYKVFKDGVYLGPVGTDKNYYKDTAYTAGAHIYEVLAVDSKGRDGARARAEIPAVSLALAGYGSFVGDSEALNKGFFDYVRFTISNAGSQAIAAGPVALTVGGVQAVPAQTITVQPGASAEAAAVVYTNAQAANTLSAKGVLTLPRGGDAAISVAINFTMAARDAQSPVVEVLPDALVRGSYSNVRVKFNNRGSAPADIVTARKIGGVIEPSDSVYAKLLTLSGLLLAQAPLTQTNADMVSSGGDVIYFVRIMPGGSYTFEPIKLAVSELAESVTVMGVVNGFAYSLNYNPVYAAQVYTASNDVKTELAVPYTATIYPEHPIYDQGSSIKIMGHVDDVWSNILSSFPVVVSIGNNGYTRTMQTITDSTGDYNITFTPNPGESGIYSLGVRHPDIVGDAATSSFTIVGFGFNYTDYSLTMLQGSSYPFEVILKNTGGSPLEGLVFSVEPISGDGVTLTPNQGLPQILQPGWQMKIGLTCAAGVSATHGRMNFNVHDSNGFMRTMPITVTVVAPQVIPKMTPQVFSLGMLAGDSRIQTITVANIGFTTWTNVNVMNPTLSWVKVDGMSGLIKSLGSIPPGGTASFTLKIEPPSDQATQAYAQNPLVNIISDNFQTVAINACITVTSARNANIYFNVTNADKQPLDPTRFIGGANITLTSLDIAGLSMTGKTDANGFVAIGNVPSGKYTYRVESAGAQTVSNSITIEPGLDQTLNILLPTSMVTYTWSVTPTTVVDKYDITLDMTFKTDVPAPAIVITPPLISKDMVGGQTLYVQYTITNRGLISVFDFQLEPEMIDPAVKLELPFTSIPEIKPGQTITVPVKIYLDHASCHEARINHRGRYMCAAGNWTDLLIERLRILVGSECLGGGGSGNETTTVGAIGGGGGNSGNTTSISYNGVGAAEMVVVVPNPTVNGVCGAAGCKSDTDCAPCKVCNVVNGLCEASVSKAGFVVNSKECGGSLCRKEVCKADGGTECVTKNIAEKIETNNMLKGVLEPGKKYSELTSKCSSRIQDPTHDTRGDQECTNSPDSVTISITEYVQDNLPRVIRVCGVLDTHSSCLIHDFAYNTCYNPPQTGPGQPFSKIQADSNLRNGIRATCSAMFSTDPECLHECNSVADMFYSGVSLVNTFYEIDQIGACLCCNAIE